MENRMLDKIYKRISNETGMAERQVSQSVVLLDEGNTIPFIARYRKEMTGGLTDEDLRLLKDKLDHYRSLEERRLDVLRLIDAQGKLNPELEHKVGLAVTVTELDDLYRPYRPKKRTRASVAREKGLEPLAFIVLEGRADPYPEAGLLIDAKVELNTIEDVLQGVSDIIAENIAENAIVRQTLRRFYQQKAEIAVLKRADQDDKTYDHYNGYSELLVKTKAHRILAINRGVKEKVLDFKLVVDEQAVQKLIEAVFIGPDIIEFSAELIRKTIQDSFKRLLHPSLEREVWQGMLEKAQKGALAVFRANLKKRLLVSPIRNSRVLGWDPGFRTGCKLAAVSETGRLLETAAVFPTAPRNDLTGARTKLLQMLSQHQIDYIAIGNGTASRESELFIAETIRENKLEVKYTIVNEAGASVYSASPAAGKEFPDLDVAERSAVSIARRLQDPLAELVKIDPKAIGVGQYQHDMPAKELDSSLTGTVEDCVNSVGVDLNSASAALLSYVAGINSSVAAKIVNFRDGKGLFSFRDQLREISGLGPKVFKQCAGFLRLPESANYLDRSAVHPESYELADQIMEKIGIKPEDLGSAKLIPAAAESLISELAKELNAGVPTVRDIIEEFRKPGRDPREDLPKPVFLKTVTDLEDLEPGMVLAGIVRNIVDFGAFIDIGVHHDGLVHLSEISDRYIKHPLDVLQIEAEVKVRILDIDRERKRISLSIKQAKTETLSDH
jgi:protein Tex